MILEFCPLIRDTPSGWMGLALAIGFVVGVSMIKDIYEDVRIKNYGKTQVLIWEKTTK